MVGIICSIQINDDEGVEFIIDITEKKKTEKQLHDSEQRFRLATEAAQMYSWEINAKNGQFQSPKMLPKY